MKCSSLSEITTTCFALGTASRMAVSLSPLPSLFKSDSIRGRRSVLAGVSVLVYRLSAFYFAGRCHK